MIVQTSGRFPAAGAQNPAFVQKPLFSGPILRSASNHCRLCSSELLCGVFWWRGGGGGIGWLLINVVGDLGCNETVEWLCWTQWPL